MSREAFVPIPPPDRYVPKAIGIDRAQIGLVVVEADLITNFEIFGLFSGHEVSHITELYENYNVRTIAAKYRKHHQRGSRSSEN
jgi:hypothetical protein